MKKLTENDILNKCTILILNFKLETFIFILIKFNYLLKQLSCLHFKQLFS